MTAAIRSTPTPENYGTSIGEKTIARKISIETEALWRYSVVPLTSVAGTNTVTADVDTAVVAALTAYQKGQKYSIIPANTNSSTVTLNINSVGAVALKDGDGAALVSGAFIAGRMHIIEHDGTNFRIIMPSREFLAATKAEQETGTSLVVGVTPGRQQDHASATKAWIRFNGTGTPAINAAYNCASITDRGVGKWSINFTTAFSSVNYGAAGIARSTTSDDGNSILSSGAPAVLPTVSAFPVSHHTASIGAEDSAGIHAIFTGAQ